MIAALFFAQAVVPTPLQIGPTATPAAISERSVLADCLAKAQSSAKVLGGTLGAVIVDTSNGATADINGDISLPAQSVQKLPLAVLTYRAIDDGRLQAGQIVHVTRDDLVPFVSLVNANYAKRTDYTVGELVALMVEESDNSAANVLLRMNGGPFAVNAALRTLGYDGILVADHDDGFAKPIAISRLLVDLERGTLLTPASQKALLSMLGKSMTFPGRLRAGFPPGTIVEHKTGTSGSNDGVTDATNDVGIVHARGRTFIIVAMLAHARGDAASRDAILASVSRCAFDAMRQFPI